MSGKLFAWQGALCTNWFYKENMLPGCLQMQNMLYRHINNLASHRPKLRKSSERGNLRLAQLCHTKTGMMEYNLVIAMNS